MKILHIITSLEFSGEESPFFILFFQKEEGDFEHTVISLTSKEPMVDKIGVLGVKVHYMDTQSGFDCLVAFPRLVKYLKKNQPDVVHCWMYRANLFGGLAAKIAGIPVLWSIHHDSLDSTLQKQHTIWAVKFGAYLSRWLPKQIYFYAESTMRRHLEIGYDEKKSCVIPKGINTEKN